jgi:membrane protein required for beta-lactamase induction
MEFYLQALLFWAALLAAACILFGLAAYANIHRMRERRRMTPAERKADDVEDRRDWQPYQL